MDEDINKRGDWGGKKIQIFLDTITVVFLYF